MVTLPEKRKKRGEVTQAEIAPFFSMSIDELLCQICSPKPNARTCASTVLGNYKVPKVVAGLCQRLKIEKKLYCKIAISDSLVKIGSLSIQPLLELLGKIGQNQETEVPQKGINKISYPLPRDIAARALCRMGRDILHEVFEFLEKGRQPFELEQAIDVIGHILFTDKLIIDSKILIRISDKYSNFPMIQFKIIRCFSGFTDNEAKQYLYNRLKSSDLGFQFEAARSLVLSGQHLPDDGFELSEDILVFAKQLTKKFNGRKTPRR